MSPESTTFTKVHPGHQADALSSTARHLTQRDFPGSNEVFQKIKALIGGKSTENIPQIQKLLEEMQTAYSKRISNLLSNIQSGSIRIRDAHQEVQQMLHEIQVFKGKDMPEEVAAVTEAITSMCDQISKKVQAVKELIDEVPVVAPAVIAPAEPAKTMTAVTAPAVTPTTAPIVIAPTAAGSTEVPPAITLAPTPIATVTPVAATTTEIDQSKEKLLATWKREIHNNTKGDSLTRKLLLVIAEKGVRGEAAYKADLATLLGVEERVIGYTLQNWKRTRMAISFTLHTTNPYSITEKDQEAPAINAPSSTSIKPLSAPKPVEILDIDDAQKTQWLEAVRANSKVETATQKALVHIVETCKTGTTWEALMRITGQETPRLVYDCLRAWLYDKKGRLPFTLEIKLQSGIKIAKKVSAANDTVKAAAAEPPKAPIAKDETKKIDIDSEEKAKWLQYIHEHTRTEKVRENASGYGKTRIALEHIVENYQTGITWEELATITESKTAFAIFDCVRAWLSRNKNAPFQLHITNTKAEILSRTETEPAPAPLVATAEAVSPVAKADVTEPAPKIVPPIAKTTPPAPAVIPPVAKASPAVDTTVETSLGPVEWFIEIGKITSPNTPNGKILMHMANRSGRETTWLELLQISGEEMGTEQIEKRIGRWQEKLGKNVPFKIVTSASGAKMVPKNTPEEVATVATTRTTTVATTRTTTAATVATVIATIAEPQPIVPPEASTSSEAETSGHQGKAMMWISKLPPGRMAEKVAYEALAGKFGTEVTKEDLMNIERAYNRERNIGKIDMISFIYRLENDRVPFGEMPFIVVKSGKGFKMMQKETKKTQAGAPLPEATPEQIRKEKAMKWLNELNLDKGTIIYRFLKTLAENPSAKVSDRKILEEARKINPKMTTDDLYALFSDSKKKGRIKAATYPMSNYTLDIELKTQRTDDADKYFFKLHEIRL